MSSGRPASLEGLTTLNARTRLQLHATGGKKVRFVLYRLTWREAEMHQAAGPGDDRLGTETGFPGRPARRPGPMRDRPCGATSPAAFDSSGGIRYPARRPGNYSEPGFFSGVVLV